MVKRARSLFNSFCSSVAKEIRLVPSRYYLCVLGWEKIGVRLKRSGTHGKGRRKNSVPSPLPMSIHVPQPYPSLPPPQKHINSDWVRVWKEVARFCCPFCSSLTGFTPGERGFSLLGPRPKTSRPGPTKFLVAREKTPLVPRVNGVPL